MISCHYVFRRCISTPPGWLLLCLVVVLLTVGGFLSCGGGSTAASTPPCPVSPCLALTALTSAEVQAIVENAALAADVPMVVAVSDRGGHVLALFRNPSAPATAAGNIGATVDANELAVALARTAAYFSNNQAPISSRTVRFLSGIHFPPGVAGTPSADLYGIENTNRGCAISTNFLPGQQVDPSRSVNGATNGLGIITGKADLNDGDPTSVNPGGVPLFRISSNGIAVVGGIGVVSTSPAIAEFAAVSGAAQSGFLPTAAQLPAPGVVVVGGIVLPFVNQTTRPAGLNPGSTTGSYVLGPNPGALPPEGDLIGPNGGSGGLTQSDVSKIVQQTIGAANVTRAAIRLPDGSRTRMTIAVADLDGTILALHRMADGTYFSIDVAAAKARNVIWFSSGGSVDLPGVPAGTAVTNRTISFGAQPLFPPGIDGAGAGPFFNLFRHDTTNPCTQGSQPAGPNQSGVVFFPGSLPLYKNGVLVGGLGVSGDGVDEDDYVTFQGAQGFLAPDSIHADTVVINNVRLPYLKFPRNPTN
jgi:uncharacterized protein GlcG (DUF336 family)